MNAMWQDICKAHEKHPELYREWLPLFEASNHKKNALRSIDSLDELEAFMIEDIANVADRNRGKRLKRTVHPLQQDHLSSVQNDFFQFMIGNTDFSSAYQHNEKLIFVDGRQAIPIPYDFDMSGMVNAHYAEMNVTMKSTFFVNVNKNCIIYMKLYKKD